MIPWTNSHYEWFYGFWLVDSYRQYLKKTGEMKRKKQVNRRHLKYSINFVYIGLNVFFICLPFRCSFIIIPRLSSLVHTWQCLWTFKVFKFRWLICSKAVLFTRLTTPLSISSVNTLNGLRKNPWRNELEQLEHKHDPFSRVTLKLKLRTCWR